MTAPRPRLRKVCLDCPAVISGRARRCATCGTIYREQRKKERERGLVIARRSPLKAADNTSILTTQPFLPKRGRYVYRTDFTLHLDEMKRQLAATTHCLQPRDYRTPSPLELSTLGEHRPRTGRPRSTQ